MTQTYDVTIIGGGIIGTTIARTLSKHKLNVALLEKANDVAMGSTKANSAIVHGGYAESHSKLKGRVCYQGRKMFPQLDKELHFGFKPIGSLVLAFNDSDKPGLEKLYENGKLNGLPDLEIIDKERIIKMEPSINPSVKWALYCKGAGVCSPYEMAIAMMENAITNGVELFLNSEVCGISKTKNFEIKTTSGKTFNSKFVVNAAGVNADKIAKMCNAGDFSITPRSGEYILFEPGAPPKIDHVLFQMPTKMGKGILVTPTVYGNLMVGPDAIDDNKNDLDTHVNRLYNIFDQSRLTTDKTNIHKFLRSFAGTRSVSSTDDFIIEMSRPGFVNAAGIQSPGLTSSPAIAELVKDILNKNGLPLEENRNFNPNRKPTYKEHPPIKPKVVKELAKLPEGTPNRIVCRCEQVYEEAIRDAATRGIPITSVDAIKRRTRAGMGVCQGKFCIPRTASILSNIANQKVTLNTDIEDQKVKRVNRKEMIEYYKKQ
ncbi:glycerol-3-phosphate dehydrogenase [Tritrichomonas foetus]|uniref:Glycerol-3-phosphate dehydrogenase n=1 Tax=Tritrichomonas foetus TaxID=1144522 RepID=A0A1J4KBX4_9EUKA|nr:glycerol-3-phosphate dehydrogenase [Tritrichomonas foetus]|eukprot:OHT08466.1 glycerol-3-phosphate dehydrogenase [Tritrichomonas foetus]